MEIFITCLVEDICTYILSDVLLSFDSIEPFDIVLDTETTGLPKTKGFNNYYPYTDLSSYDSSRITEFCWSTLEEGELSVPIIRNEVIKPSDVTEDQVSTMLSKIPKDKMKQDIKEIMNGKDIKFVFEEFKKDLRNCRFIISHNIDFDINVIKSEAYRISDSQLIELIDSKQLKCTMKFSSSLNSGSSDRNSRSRGPFMSLDKLYETLTGKKREGSHRAEKDVKDLIECLGIIKKNYVF